MINSDVDIGNGVTIMWLRFEDMVIGGVVTHPRESAQNLDRVCSGSFYFMGNAYSIKFGRGNDKWQWNGNLEKPTISPDFSCSCGFTGEIRNGIWTPKVEN